MILTCGQCAKRYLVKPEDISSQGRKVRCVACGHAWIQKPMPAADEPTIPTTSAKSPSPLSTPPYSSANDLETNSPASLPFYKRIRKSWAIPLVCILLMAGSSYGLRNTIVHFFPATRVVYDSVGIPTKNQDSFFELHKPKAVYLEKGDQKFIVVSGDLSNTTDQDLDSPTLTFQLQGPCAPQPLWTRVLKAITPTANEDKNVCVLKEFKFQIPEKQIFAGESIHFESAPLPVDQKGYQVRITF